MKKFEIKDENILFEEFIRNNPSKIKPWISYIENKRSKAVSSGKQEDLHFVFFLFERAILKFPKSFKLWNDYLLIRKEDLATRNVRLTSKEFENVNKLYERCVKELPKMPTLWLDYAKFISKQKKITETRRIFDKALKNIAMTQHMMIWKDYITWIRESHVPTKTGINTFERFSIINEKTLEDFVEFLKERKSYGRCCKELWGLLQNPASISKLKTTKFEVWDKIWDIVAHFPDSLAQSQDFDVEKTFREVLCPSPSSFLKTNQIVSDSGKSWVAFASYFVSQGDFDKARSLFEEALKACETVKDMNTVFDAYAKFEEGLTKAFLQQQKEKEQKMKTSEEEEGEGDDEDLEKELEEQIGRWEKLLDRREMLLSDVKIKKNQNNILEWLNRVMIISKMKDVKEEDKRKMVVDTFSKAVEKVDPFKVQSSSRTRLMGSYSYLWISFAHFYEQYGDINKAFSVLRVATKKNFKNYDDKAVIWCEMAEMSIRNKDMKQAIEILEEGLGIINKDDETFKKITLKEDKETSKMAMSLRLWSFMIDIYESMCDYQKCFACYDLLIDRKIITPSLLISYCEVLKSEDKLEEMFNVFEKGVRLFNYPAVHAIWIRYLEKLIERNKFDNKERVREVFESWISKIPLPEEKKKKELQEESSEGFKFYIKASMMFANYERMYGSSRSCLKILSEVVDKTQDVKIFNIYVNLASDYLPISKIREIFESTINTFPILTLPPIYKRFIMLEIKLGEIERARTLFLACSKYMTTKVFNNDLKAKKDETTGVNINQFYDEWESFEKTYGNIDSYKNFYKIKHTNTSAFI